MKFTFGFALLAISTEAAISSFTLPTATECQTTECTAVSTAGATVTVTAAQINACLTSAPSTCTYIAAYTVPTANTVRSCSLQSNWASGSTPTTVHGYDLSALAPIVQGTLTALTGSMIISLEVPSSASTCTAKYLLTPINTSETTCTAAATHGGSEVPYAASATSVQIPLTQEMFSATTPLGTNLQVGAIAYTSCGTSFQSARRSAVTYTMSYSGTATASGALSTMAFGLLPALYLMI